MKGPFTSMKCCLAHTDRVIRWVALWAGGLMLVGLMGLTVVDVLLRYAFNSPLYGARDVAKLMLLVMVALSVAYSARTGGQIAIELFSRIMGRLTKQLTETLVRLAAVAMLAVLSWRLWLSGQNAAAFGEASLALQIPFKPFYLILSIGMLLYAIVLIVEIPFCMSGHADELEHPID